ncbi:MAG TPA: DUF456 family protein [Candidatus Baltobacteraceae bacterium]|nr:DUF456 family protein [Candidatus Baltobacteraceae bacterium]
MTTEQIIGLSLALIAMLAGLIGSVLPAIPGIPVILVAAIGHRLYFGEHGASNLVLIILAVLTIVSIAFDFLAGMFGANKFGATWRGALGAIVGGIVGLFFALPGIILGPFIGATLFELLGDRELKMALKAGLGATIGMFAGIIGKFAIAVVMILLFATNVILRSTN